MKNTLAILGQSISKVVLALLVFPLCLHQSASAKSNPGLEPDEDKTLSPYFFVKSEDPSLDRLPLKATSAAVNISGTIADVVVTQTYRNEGKKAIEAVYVFPASTRAAVYGMKMTIGERTITAQIQKREEARQAYEKARQEGKSASLLEQHRPNVFQMNVANILPGDEIRTELRYTEILIPDSGVYDFIYPTVVGPRYSNQPKSSAPPSERWTRNPYLHEGEAPPYSFDIKISLAAGVPIQEMTCSSHKTSIQYSDKTSAVISLDNSERTGGNRDFILKYRLSGERIESGILLLEGDRENFFLLMMQPPRRVSSAASPPREYIFIVDVSGSMHGYPLEISKKLFRDLLSGLRQPDTFNVLLFSGGSQLFSERSLPATPQNVQQAIGMIDRQQGGGGTELLPALRRALALPKTEGVSRTLIIATDGYVAVEPEAFDLIRESIGDANFFPFGIGTSVNRHLIEGMARVGAGEPFAITKQAEAAAIAEKFRRYVEFPVLTGAKLDFGKFEAFDIEPLKVPDLFAERPIMIFGKWKGKPQGTITLTGKTGKQDFVRTLDVSQTRPMAENTALRYLWARSRIAQLGDYGNLRRSDDNKRTITELGLKYNLLTAYTSFVAIDTEVRRKEGDVTTVKQPLPLPEGVSDLAVGETNMNYQATAPASRQMSSPFAFGRGAAPLAASPSPGKKAKKESDTAAPRLILEKLTIKGEMPEETVRKYVEQHTTELAQCLRETAAPVKGIVFKWTIESGGSVKDIQVTLPGRNPHSLIERLRGLLEKWVFPMPGDGARVQVEMVMSLVR